MKSCHKCLNTEMGLPMAAPRICGAIFKQSSFVVVFQNFRYVHPFLSAPLVTFVYQKNGH